MQSFATMNLMRSLPATIPRRNPWVAHARALTFTVWFFLLLLNYWWRQEWDAVAQMGGAGVNLKKYYYFGIGIAVAGHLTLGLGVWVETIFSFLSTTVGRALTAFFVYMFVLAQFFVAPRTRVLDLAATFCVLIL